MTIRVRRPDFIDIDPRIPFGIIAQFDLTRLAAMAASENKRHFRISLLEPQVKLKPLEDDAEPVEVPRHELGFLLIPGTRSGGPGGLIGRGVRVEASDLIAAQALAQRMFEWNTGK